MSPVSLSSEAPQLLVWVFLTLPVIPLLVTGVHVPWDVLRTTVLAFIEHLLLPGPRRTQFPPKFPHSHQERGLYLYLTQEGLRTQRQVTQVGSW